MSGHIDLRTDEYWVKVVDFLSHNWAVVRLTRDGTPELLFFDDRSHVFDKLTFAEVSEAIAGLRRNGFELYDEIGDFREILAKPTPPFTMERRNLRTVYSSGDLWR